MKGNKHIIQIFAIIMISAGFLSCMEVKAGNETMDKILTPVVKGEYILFPDSKDPTVLRRVASYKVDPRTGYLNFFDLNGRPIPSQKLPSWLVKSKEIVSLGTFRDSKFQKFLIGIKIGTIGTPIEWYSAQPGSYTCILAWDGECRPHGKLYQPCRDRYPVCP